MRTVVRAVLALTLLAPVPAGAQSELDLSVAYCAGVLKQITDQYPEMQTRSPELYRTVVGLQQHLQRYFYARGYYDSRSGQPISRLMPPIAQGRADEAEAARNPSAAAGACTSECSNVARSNNADQLGRCMARCQSLMPLHERRALECMGIEEKLPF